MRWGCWVADLVADMLKCVWLLELCMCLGRSYLRRSLLPAEKGGGGGCHAQMQICLAMTELI